MLYHCFGMSSSFSKIFRVVIFFPVYLLIATFYLNFKYIYVQKCTSNLKMCTTLTFYT
jgi:predicted membrane channel-forming protein YqfA (hemolysin III family)